MSTIKSEEIVKRETVCEDHAEENKSHHKTGSDSDWESVGKERNHQSPEISLRLKPANKNTVSIEIGQRDIQKVKKLT